MEDKMLLEVTVVTDDSTGCYRVGEIDFGISGRLDSYLENHGVEGGKEIIQTLSYLIYEVEKRILDISHKQNMANIANSTKVDKN